MAENSPITWTDHTFNPWWGCVKVSPACKNCYAERDSKRYGFNVWGEGSERRFFSDDHWKAPVKWNAQAKALGVRKRVFCASMADVFEVPFYPKEQDVLGAELRKQLDRERMRLFRLIEATPYLDWLLLTKRPHYVAGHIPNWWRGNWPEHVAIGTTVETQGWLEQRIEALMGLAARVRFLSIEPQLGPIDLRRVLLRGEMGEVYVDALTGCHEASIRHLPLPARKRPLEWIIAGGESGPEARPSHPDWFRALRDDCQLAGTPFHFKQWGEWLPGQNDPAPSDPSQRVAHWQDGGWGPRDTKDPERNYVMWDPAGVLHQGGTRSDENYFEVKAWAARVGKKKAGRLLDGREWNEFPVPVHV